MTQLNAHVMLRTGFCEVTYHHLQVHVNKLHCVLIGLR